MGEGVAGEEEWRYEVEGVEEGAEGPETGARGRGQHGTGCSGRGDTGGRQVCATMRTSVLVLLLMTAVVVIKCLLVAGLLYLSNVYPSKTVLNTYSETICTVTKIEEEAGSSRVYITVRYDAHGQPIKSEISTDAYDSKNSLEVFEKVQCLYDPDDTSRVEIKEWTKEEYDDGKYALAVYPWIFAAVPEVLVAVPYGCLVLYWWWKERTLEVPSAAPRTGRIMSSTAAESRELEALLEASAATDHDSECDEVPRLLRGAVLQAVTQPRELSVGREAHGYGGVGSVQDGGELVQFSPAREADEQSIRMVFTFRVSHPVVIGIGITLICLLALSQILDLIYVIFFQPDVVGVTPTLLNATYLIVMFYVELLCGLYLYYTYHASERCVVATATTIFFSYATVWSVLFGYPAIVQCESVGSHMRLEKYYNPRSGSGVRIGDMTLYMAQEEADRLHARLRVMVLSTPLSDMSGASRVPSVRIE